MEEWLNRHSFANIEFTKFSALKISNGKEDNITDGLRNLCRKEYEKYKDIFQEEVMK